MFKLINKYQDHILVFILLFVSGNPLNRSKFTEMFLLLGLLGMKKYNKTTQKAIGTVIPYILFLATIFLLQAVILNANALMGPLRLFTKIILGVSILYYLKESFIRILLEVVVFICVVSLPLYLLDITLAGGLFNTSIGKLLSYGETASSVGLYTVLSSEHHNFGRNCGMFWEPGAFAGILTVTMALNTEIIFKKENRKKLLILVISLLSTMSTTGYIAFGSFIAIRNLLSDGKMVTKVAILAFVILGATYVFTQMDFLSEKIVNQFTTATIRNRDGYNNTRFGSMYMDWHYINKQPFIGNGYQAETRWRDHPRVVSFINKGNDIGSGNGLTNYAASMGIPALFLYFFLIARRLKKRHIYIPLIVTIISTLFGEQWLNFSLFLAFPFIIIPEDSHENSNTLNLL